MHGLAMLAAYKWGLFIVLFVDEAGNSVPKDFSYNPFSSDLRKIH